MRALDHLVNYTYSGIAPNTFAAFCATRDGPEIITSMADGQHLRALLQSVPTVVSLLLGYVEHRDYQHMKRELQARGWDERIVKPHLYEWCQRHAARQAATDLGYAQEFEAYARREGHRWYHVLPKIHRFRELRRAVREEEQLEIQD